MNPNIRFASLVLFLLSPGATHSPLLGEVTMPAIFSDHAVLQRSDRTTIWGKANPGEQVRVTLGNMSQTARAGADRRWRVDLDLRRAAEGPHKLVVRGTNELVFTDILVGEVWLASGQSNMEWWLRNNRADKAEIAASANEKLRQFLVKQTVLPAPSDEVEGWWTVAGPETSGGFSAVGYYYGKKLQQELGVPVAIINASRGRTGIEGWIGRDGLARVPELDAATRAYENERIAAQKVSETEASLPGKKPRDPEQIGAYLYNGMIAPLVPYAIRGVIWYQGETNTSRAWQYRTSFPLLIKDWRSKWGRGDFPFYFCQLANHGGKSPGHMESGWSEIREAQSLALSLPNTGQAVLIDIGEAADVHPRNKRDVGDRLARIALAQTYKRAAVFSGPVYVSMKVDQPNRAIRLKFTQAVGGLIARKLPAEFHPSSIEERVIPLVRNSPGSELEGFEICGDDRRWTWAQARIAGDEIEVWADAVERPVAVRYAWSMNPTCNLYNGEGLPAAPFRTDDFPVSTRDVRY